MVQISPNEERELDAWWNAPPRALRPTDTADAELHTPHGAATITAPCRACGNALNARHDLRGWLCGRCRTRLGAVVGATQARITTAVAHLDTIAEAWAWALDQADATTVTRFTRLDADRGAAEAGVLIAEQMWHVAGSDVTAAALDTARTHLRHVQQSIARLAVRPQDALAALIRLELQRDSESAPWQTQRDDAQALLDECQLIAEDRANGGRS